MNPQIDGIIRDVIGGLRVMVLTPTEPFLDPFVGEVRDAICGDKGLDPFIERTSCDRIIMANGGHVQFVCGEDPDLTLFRAHQRTERGGLRADRLVLVTRDTIPADTLLTVSQLGAILGIQQITIVTS